MAESVVRSAHACGFERKSGEKERGGEKGEENWLVGPVHGKERKGKKRYQVTKRNILWWSRSGRERGEERWEEAVKKRRGVEVQVGKESWTRNGTV